MRLTVQKRLASSVLGVSPKKVWIDPERLEEVREAITKRDIKEMISFGLIKKKNVNLHSRVRARLRLTQKRKGRRRGKGTRKGAFGARNPKKAHWVTHIRAQRRLLHSLLDQGLIERSSFLDLIRKAKGGFFRNIRHVKLYISEHRLLLKKQVAQPEKPKKESKKETAGSENIEDIK